MRDEQVFQAIVTRFVDLALPSFIKVQTGLGKGVQSHIFESLLKMMTCALEPMGGDRINMEGALSLGSRHKHLQRVCQELSMQNLRFLHLKPETIKIRLQSKVKNITGRMVQLGTAFKQKDGEKVFDAVRAEVKLIIEEILVSVEEWTAQQIQQGADRDVVFARFAECVRGPGLSDGSVKRAFREESWYQRRSAGQHKQHAHKRPRTDKQQAAFSPLPGLANLPLPSLRGPPQAFFHAPPARAALPPPQAAAAAVGLHPHAQTHIGLPGGPSAAGAPFVSPYGIFMQGAMQGGMQGGGMQGGGMQGGMQGAMQGGMQGMQVRAPVAHRQVALPLGVFPGAHMGAGAGFGAYGGGWQGLGTGSTSLVPYASILSSFFGSGAAQAYARAPERSGSVGGEASEAAPPAGAEEEVEEVEEEERGARSEE